MFPSGSLAGPAVERRFTVRATFVHEQLVVCDPTSARIAQLGNPTSATSYAKSMGIVLDQTPPTYTATQGTGTSSANRKAKVSCSPFQIIHSKISGGSTDDTAHSATTYTLLTTSAASSGGILVTADVSTVDMTGGILYCLSGANKGQARTLTSQVNSTSCTVTVPFDFAIAVGDTFLRVNQDVGNESGSLTTTYKQIDGSVAYATSVTGAMLPYDVQVDITDQGTPTAPLAFVDVILADHIWNRVS